MRRSYRHFLLVFVTFLAGAGCIETDIPPVGSYSEVMVITDDGGGGSIGRMLNIQLGQPLNFFVSQEPEFILHHVTAADLADVPFKSVVIAGPANEATHVGHIISSMLGPAAAERARGGEVAIFKRDNLPTGGQVTVIVTGPSEDAVARTIAMRGDDINAVLEASIRQRMRANLLKDGPAQVSTDLQRKYGFIVKVPSLYELISDEPHPPGVELLRDRPSRLLGVFWLDWDAPITLEQEEALFDVRRDYVFERYAGDEMDSTRVRFAWDRLGEYPAIRMNGYWSSGTTTAGGAYESYFIYDEPGQLLWVVDLLVFAPGVPKQPLFRELLALGETFRYD